MQDEVIYRCINAACARSLPRRVNFCPFCGTGQHAGAARPAPDAVPLVMPAARPASIREPAPAEPVRAASAPPVPPTYSAPPPPQQQQRPAPRTPAPAQPPLREPVRLRYWLLALAILAAIWFYNRPGTNKLEGRVDAAIALAADCNPGEAQAELIARRKAEATPEQLQRVQEALNSAAPGCAKKRQRPKASSVLAKPSAKQQTQSARTLIAEAERAIELGNYKAAADKMEVCTTMVDADNRQCILLKARADRLRQQMATCLADGRDWIGGRCE